MDKIDKIRNIIKEDKITELKRYSNDSVAYMFLKILQDDLSSFSYDSFDLVDYLYKIVELLPHYLKNNPKGYKAEEQLKAIHQKIKTFLVQKPGYIDKTNHNYKVFKNMINDVELIQMSILYDYSDRYQGSKYKLINYIIFELKSIPIFNDALNRFPHLVNYFDKDDTNLIVTVTNEYINKVMKYTNEKGIDDIIYYDQIITSILKSKEFMFDVIDKQTILKKVRESLNNLTGDKERKTFYLNLLVEKINGKEETLSSSYLEYKYKIPIYFNPAIDSEVRKIKDNYSISKGRKIVDDYILSFDGEDASEIDDALSINIKDNGNIMLSVHIADPLDIINEDSIIFEEAAKRTTSIYLSDTTISMFPKELSTDLISLKEKNYRPATTYLFEFDKNGNLINYDFIKSIIKVNKNLTYNDFNSILNMNGTDKLKDTIDKLSYASTILQNYYSVDPLYGKINRAASNITNTNIIGTTGGEKVVESSMIFTNHIVAKYFKENNLPFNFRNHNINNTELTNRLNNLKEAISKEKDSEGYIRYIEMVKNFYPRAYNDVVCTGHDGLGLKEYCHITSPLRRFEDIICLICLDKLYFNSYKEKTKDYVKKLVVKHARNINKKRPSIEKYTEEYERLKRCV